MPALERWLRGHGDVLLPIIIPGGFLLWVIFEMLGKMWEGYVATEGAEVPGEVI